MKGILLSLLILGNILFISHVSAEVRVIDVVEARAELLEITKGESYVERIDAIVDTYKGNEVVLQKLSDRIAKLQDAMNSYSGERKEDIQVLLNYLDYSVQITLQEIAGEEEDIQEEDNEIEDKENEDTTSNTENTSPERVFPGFDTDYIEQDKVILGGSSAEVFKSNLVAISESLAPETVVVSLKANDISNLKESIVKASLYLEGTLIAEESSSSVDVLTTTDARIVFDNVEDFIITQNTRQYRLVIETASIGYQRTGKTIEDIYVDSVLFDDIIGLSSGKKAASYTDTESGELFSIVPGTLTVSMKTSLTQSSIPQINIRGNIANNVIDTSGSGPTLELKKLRFRTLGSSNISGTTFSLANEDSSSNRVTGVVSGDIIEFDMSPLNSRYKSISNSSSGEDFKIYIEGIPSGATLNLSLIRDGIDYEALGVTGADDIQIQLEKDLDLGARSY